MAIEKEKLLDMYRTMVRIRVFEEKIAEDFAAGKIPGFVHISAGQLLWIYPSGNPGWGVSSPNLPRPVWCLDRNRGQCPARKEV